MSKQYISIKVPILNDVKVNEIIKSFNQKQLCYVLTLTSALEKKESENKKLKKRIDKAIKIIDYRLKENNKHINARMEMSYYRDLKTILKGDSNE